MRHGTLFSLYIIPKTVIKCKELILFNTRILILFLYLYNLHFLFIASYFRADHEDQDVVLFNRVMLPAYYGLLRLCCQQSRTFTRQLAAHQNIQWAFKNITPHPTQYSTVSFSRITLLSVEIGIIRISFYIACYSDNILF